MSRLLTNEPQACVTGHPIAHSRSPLIHNYWLKTLNLKGHYGRVDTPPERFSEFVNTMRAQGYVGCNVTLPNKERAFHLAAKTTARAQLMQAANTLWFEGKILYADNTDIEGFLSNLDQRHPHWDQSLEKAVILGAGGAAAAIMQGLIERRAERIILVNRTRAKAEQLADRFLSASHPLPVEIISFDNLDQALDEATFLVNTTSLGMKGQPELTINLSRMKRSAVVTDIVYVPLVTPLLKQAMQCDLTAIDGLGMLLHQAVPGFEHWFHRRPQVTEELRKLVEADILAGAS